MNIEKNHQRYLNILIIVVSLLIFVIVLHLVGLLSNKYVATANQGWSWQTLFSILGLFGVFGTFITAMVGVQRYRYEKNRDLYLRRLHEVYAPLVGLIIRQETLREFKFPHIKRRIAPIITTQNVKRTETLDLSGKSPVLKVEEGEPEVGILDRKQFLKLVDDTNKGLARPNLLLLLYKYEILIYLEELPDHDEDWQKAATEKVRIENLLIDEILSGYEETIKKLHIDDDYFSAIERERLGI